jgi:hypothetical protein
MMRNFEDWKVELFIDGLIIIMRGVTMRMFDDRVRVRSCNDEEL